MKENTIKVNDFKLCSDQLCGCYEYTGAKRWHFFYIFRSYFRVRGNFPVFRISKEATHYACIFHLTSCIPISALSHPLPFSIQPFLWAIIWFRISTLVGTGLIPNSTRKYISLILYLGKEVKFQSPSAASGKGKKYKIPLYKNAIKSKNPAKMKAPNNKTNAIEASHKSAKSENTIKMLSNQGHYCCLPPPTNFFGDFRFTGVEGGALLLVFLLIKKAGGFWKAPDPPSNPFR